MQNAGFAGKRYSSRNRLTDKSNDSCPKSLDYPAAHVIEYYLFILWCSNHSVDYIGKKKGWASPLEVIKNSAGKTVCQADATGKSVVIMHKGQKTIIKFLDDGTMRVINTKVA